MTAMCLAGCTKEEAFVDSCDSEIAEQVTSIMQESQKGCYNLENCEVFVTEESKKDGYVVRRRKQRFLSLLYKRIKQFQCFVFRRNE